MVSSAALWRNIIAALILFFLINQFFNENPKVEATLFMAWGTLFLIVFLKLLTKRVEKAGMFGAYASFYAGVILEFVFLVWVVNNLLKLLNLVFIALNWEFKIGNLFPDTYNFLASLPSLICGLILILVGLNWGKSPSQNMWYRCFQNGKTY